MRRLDEDKSLYELKLDIENLSALSPENELQANYELILDKKYDTINQHIENVLSTASNQLTYSGIVLAVVLVVTAVMQSLIQIRKWVVIKQIKNDVTKEIIESINDKINKTNSDIAKGILPDGDIKTKIIQTIIDSAQFNEAVNILIESKTTKKYVASAEQFYISGDVLNE